MNAESDSWWSAELEEALRAAPAGRANRGPDFARLGPMQIREFFGALELAQRYEFTDYGGRRQEAFVSALDDEHVQLQVGWWPQMPGAVRTYGRREFLRLLDERVYRRLGADPAADPPPF